ncbi:hypothetical protein DFH09DRAFT_1082029 [Mycena vulgaris]|nr:hypothetical protein DFH09DRAFT_1082029 [Mycena vulgaris]
MFPCADEDERISAEAKLYKWIHHRRVKIPSTYRAAGSKPRTLEYNYKFSQSTSRVRAKLNTYTVECIADCERDEVRLLLNTTKLKGQRAMCPPSSRVIEVTMRPSETSERESCMALGLCGFTSGYAIASCRRSYFGATAPSGMSVSPESCAEAQENEHRRVNQGTYCENA